MEKINQTIGRTITRIQLAGVSPLMCVVFIALLIVPIFVKDEFILRLLISSLMFGGLAMAFDFTSGYINIVNFGFSAFMGLGAYTSGLIVLNLGLSPWLGMLIGAIMAGVIGFGLGLLTIRLGGIFAACMAWFVALAMMAITANWVGLTRGNSGLSIPPLFDTYRNLPYYYVMFAIVVFIYLLLIVISKSKIGLAFRAIGQDPQAAASSGIFATRYKVINFTISCCLAGLIGGFYAHYIGILTPQVMHTRNTVEVMVISYIGGRGTIWGGLIAAIIIIPLMEYTKGLMEVRLILYGAAMIFIMIFYPKGLVGLWEGGVAFFKKKGGPKRITDQESAPSSIK
jgi:branched-chain amino acid transport system permease protein